MAKRGADIQLTKGLEYEEEYENNGYGQVASQKATAAQLASRKYVVPLRCCCFGLAGRQHPRPLTWRCSFHETFHGNKLTLTHAPLLPHTSPPS